MEIDWQDFVARQEVLVVMRFSYFGKSGWKSDFSKDREMLFATDRLEGRFALLEKLPLPSLAAQTDQNFHLLIICSDVMPDWAQARLAEICERVMPAKTYTVAPRRFGFAHMHFMRLLKRRYGQGRIIQTVLDDDDGFSTDFIASVRQELAQMEPVASENDMRFVSFARGYGFDLSPENPAEYGLFRHRYPYINLGLTMVTDVAGKNLLSISHRKTPKEHACRLVEGQPMFVRSLHASNDSRVEVSTRWKAIKKWRKDPDVLLRFPYLVKL